MIQELKNDQGVTLTEEEDKADWARQFFANLLQKAPEEPGQVQATNSILDLCKTRVHGAQRAQLEKKNTSYRKNSTRRFADWGETRRHGNAYQLKIIDKKVIQFVWGGGNTTTRHRIAQNVLHLPKSKGRMGLLAENQQASAFALTAITWALT
ncbi:hypothetical protein R1sor_013518 [Riccia sorocarpa]|uniref:Uncharacterized protein n=1 Tax=Riccia sorocarpa TaxID=122646 RepID=A0ABD3H9M5_9MARC